MDRDETALTLSSGNGLATRRDLVRDMDTVRLEILKECSRRGFAEKARYRKPVGEGIEGPSIRFVEAALRCMGYVECSTRLLDDDDRKRTLRCVVADQIKQVYWLRDIVVDKTVERMNPSGRVIYSERQNSQGRTVYLVSGTEDEITNKEGMQISKAVRQLGLRLIPADIVDEAMERVIAVIAADDKANPDDARRRLTDAFSQIGVSPGDLRQYLGHDLDKITPKELAQLRAIWTAIKDGESSWSDELELGRAATPQPPPKPTQAPPSSPGPHPTDDGGAVITEEREVDRIVARLLLSPDKYEDELPAIMKLAKTPRPGETVSDYAVAKEEWDKAKAIALRTKK